MPEEQLMMSPEEVQRTMDFILQSQANSTIRMEEIEEKHKKQQQEIDGLIEISHDLVRVSRANMQKADGLEENLKAIRRLLETSLRRINRLEQNEL